MGRGDVGDPSRRRKSRGAGPQETGCEQHICLLKTAVRPRLRPRGVRELCSRRSTASPSGARGAGAVCRVCRSSAASLRADVLVKKNSLLKLTPSSWIRRRRRTAVPTRRYSLSLAEVSADVSGGGAETADGRWPHTARDSRFLVRGDLRGVRPFL